MWSRQGDLYTLIERKKKELGKIPEETCPIINEVIEIIEQEFDKDNKAFILLEILREDNNKLRTLGKEWYEFCEELSEESDKTIKELEDEIKDKDEEIKRLEDELDSYKD